LARGHLPATRLRNFGRAIPAGGLTRTITNAPGHETSATAFNTAGFNYDKNINLLSGKAASNSDIKNRKNETEA